MEQSKKRVRFDAHFHPQTSRFHIRRRIGLDINKRLQKWWNVFRRNDIRIIVSTEHTYVNPAEGFYLIRNSKPNNFDAVVLPGIEAVSREGIELLVWSKDVSLFEDESVMTPFHKPINELVDIVSKNPNYQGSFPHSFGTGPGSAFPKLSPYEILNYSEKLGMIESYNFITHGMYNKVNIMGNVVGAIVYFLITKRRTRNESFDLLAGLVRKAQECNISFSIGNDAHNPEDVKCVGIVDIDVDAVGKLTAEKAFEALRNNKDPSVYFLNAYSVNNPLHTLTRTNSRILEELFYYNMCLIAVKSGHDDKVKEFYRQNKRRFVYDDLK